MMFCDFLLRQRLLLLLILGRAAAFTQNTVVVSRGPSSHRRCWRESTTSCSIIASRRSSVLSMAVICSISKPSSSTALSDDAQTAMANSQKNISKEVKRDRCLMRMLNIIFPLLTTIHSLYLFLFSYTFPVPLHGTPSLISPIILSHTQSH